MMSDTTVTKPGLGWLLEDFVRRVPGAKSAILASSDGLTLESACLNADEADSAAAVFSGLHSLCSGGIERVTGVSAGVRQILVERDDAIVYVMHAGAGLPPGAQVRHDSDPQKVATVLGVFAEPDADPGVIGFELAALIDSVSEHLMTPKRQSNVHAGDVQ